MTDTATRTGTPAHQTMTLQDILSDDSGVERAEPDSPYRPSGDRRRPQGRQAPRRVIALRKRVRAGRRATPLDLTGELDEEAATAALSVSSTPAHRAPPPPRRTSHEALPPHRGTAARLVTPPPGANAAPRNELWPPRPPPPPALSPNNRRCSHPETFRRSTSAMCAHGPGSAPKSGCGRPQWTPSKPSATCKPHKRTTAGTGGGENGSVNFEYSLGVSVWHTHGMEE